jgi:DNA recombination protein RmuC
MLAIQVMQQIMKDARMREAADQIRDEVMHLADDLGRLRERVQKLQTHFSQANEDVRLIAVSAEKIDRRAERIKDLEFDGDDAAIEPPRGKPELFAVPTRKLQAGE